MSIFDPKLFDKKSRAKRTNKTYTYRVIHKTIIGVCGITLTGSYFVMTENGNYKFSDDSYIIKNNKPFYSQQIIDGKRLKIVEIKTNTKSNESTYLPFAPGVCCIGSIVYNEELKIKVFCLKDTFIDKNSKVANDAWEFYRKNYEEIRKHIK